uniref:Pentatricopeptide repeat-containing protein n=1 Tax=Kalanchoe fedtschenkoi TaxID=63787 RepID=A0A7N0ZZ72_KALFE
MAAAALVKSLRALRPPAAVLHRNSVPLTGSCLNADSVVNSRSLTSIAPPSSSLLRFIQIRFWRNNKSNYLPKESSFESYNDSKEPGSVNEASAQYPIEEDEGRGRRSTYTGDSISRRDKEKFLIELLLELKDSKEDVYGSLDAWVAWEQNFPVAMLKRALLVLEKKYEWHRIIQVIKWMLSKGQGTTMGTYSQLIKALDMDQRPEEAHQFWVRKIGSDLHSVPWDLCQRMISIYYRNNMSENLIMLFKGLESFDRKPPQKSIVQKVANAFEILGQLDEKERILKKYDYLLSKTRVDFKKSRKERSKKKGKEGLDECASNMNDHAAVADAIQT